MSARYRNLLAAGLVAFAFMLVLMARGWMTSPPSVKGTVTVGGQPLEDGSITFFPIERETSGGTAGAPIIDGKFEVLTGLSEGPYRIAFHGTRPHPVDRIKVTFSDEWNPKPVQVVPELYRGQDSPLTRTVKSGYQHFQFDLPEISKKKRGR